MELFFYVYVSRLFTILILKVTNKAHLNIFHYFSL